MTCIRCKSCGVTPGKTWDLAWNHEKDLCPDCTVLHNKGKTSERRQVFSEGHICECSVNTWFIGCLGPTLLRRMTWCAFIVQKCGNRSG